MEKYSAFKKKNIGYTDVHETVKTIEKIAAAHLHEVEQRTVNLSNHTQRILEVLARLQKFDDSNTVTGSIPTAGGKNLLVLITGDKGLVGDAWQKLFNVYKNISHQGVLVIGKKGQLEVPTSDQVQHHSFLSRIPSTREIESLHEKLLSYMQNGTYNSVTTLHLSAASVVDLRPVETLLLPITLEVKTDTPTDKYPVGYPIIEGSINTLKETLLKKYLNSRLEQIILETAVAEYSARTIAMEHATSKTEEMLTHLSRVYLRDRRHLETQKQLERFAVNKISV